MSPILNMIGALALFKGENDVATIAKMLSGATDRISSLKKDIAEKYEESLSSEFDKVKKYFDELESTRGSIYESDFYTNLIRILIQSWTEYNVVEKPKQQHENVSEVINEPEKKKRMESVLIIDDLDRIDPHHTFRLFNIFSAHIDQYQHEETVNKFGFDKVIFVCDIDNVRNLFTHFYGSSESFNGYIDKFYSKEPFYYNPIPEIIENLDKFPSTNTKFRYYEFKHAAEEDYKRIKEYFQRKLAPYRAEFNELLSFVIKANGFTPRNLLKVAGDGIPISGKKKFNWYGNEVSEASFFICFVARYLLRYAGTSQDVIQILRRCEKLADTDWESTTKGFRETITASSIAYIELDSQTEAIASDESTLHKYIAPNGTAIVYEWLKSDSGDFISIRISKTENPETGEEVSFEKINPFTFLILACEKLYL